MQVSPQAKPIASRFLEMPRGVRHQCDDLCQASTNTVRKQAMALDGWTIQAWLLASTVETKDVHFG